MNAGTLRGDGEEEAPPARRGRRRRVGCIRLGPHALFPQFCETLDTHSESCSSCQARPVGPSQHTVS